MTELIDRQHTEIESGVGTALSSYFTLRAGRGFRYWSGISIVAQRLAAAVTSVKGWRHCHDPRRRFAFHGGLSPGRLSRKMNGSLNVDRGPFFASRR